MWNTRPRVFLRRRGRPRYLYIAGLGHFCRVLFQGLGVGLWGEGVRAPCP